MIKIAEKIKGCEYDFLRENKDLANSIYLVLCGSYGYGTNTENSDLDLRGVLIEDDKYIFGLDPFEQFEDLPTDTVIYGLKKFVRLCMNANPNTLELLGVDEDCIVKMSNEGKILRDNASMFFSKRVINSFGNYATAQLRRLSNAICHDLYNEKEQEVHLRNSLNAQIEHFNRTYKPFEEGSINIYIDEEKDTNIEELLFDINLSRYPVRDFVGIYSEMNNTVKTYTKLNHRNRKKDDNHLYKHAMHLIRLLITGIDLLDGKGMITKRTEENKFLMDLRNGKYTFEEIFKIADEYKIKFDNSAKNTKLPDKPEEEKIINLMISFYK